ncbi:MAG: type II toxin-antitoxin system RelE/ParE family toxin [Cytophagales bacterium]
MKVIYTDQSIKSLEETLNFAIRELGLSYEKAMLIKDQLLKRADSLSQNPNKGQQEEFLEHLKESHRRLIEGHFKIIYRIQGKIIYITDFFDTRQDPEKMKG